jgi:hypothetical protein
LPAKHDDRIALGLEYIELAPGFVKEVIDVYDRWEGREAVPMKVQELVMVLRIEVSRLYKVDDSSQESEKPKIMNLIDTRLKEYPKAVPKTQTETAGGTNEHLKRC